MDISSVAASSTAMNLMQVQYSASLSVTNQATEMVEEIMGTLLEGLSESMASITGVGSNIDMYV